MNKLFAGSLTALSILLTFACSSTDNTTVLPAPDPSSTGTPDGSTPDASTPDSSITVTPGGGTLVTCGSQVPAGALVAPSLLPTTTAPAPAGGSVSSGTYQLSAVKAYGNAAGGTNAALYASLRAKETLEVNGTEWRIAYHYEGAGRTIDGVHAGTYIAASNILGGEEKCDAGEAANGIGGFLRPYTASSGSIDIFEDDAKEIVFTYTK